MAAKYDDFRARACGGQQQPRAGLLEVDREPLDFRAIEKLARKHADQPMDFAAASVVLLVMHSGVREILTADRRDFAVYRLAGKARFIDVLGSG